MNKKVDKYNCDVHKIRKLNSPYFIYFLVFCKYFAIFDCEHHSQNNAVDA